MFFLFLVACGAPGVTADDVVTEIEAHNADPAAHGGPFASTAAVAQAVDDAIDRHEDDDDPHAGVYATPDDIDVAIADLSVEQLPLRQRRMSIPIGSAFDLDSVSLNAGGFGNTHLRVDDITGASFVFNFTVPDDIVGDELTFEILWRINTASCVFDLRTNMLDRARVGLPPVAGSATGGFFAAPANTSPAVANQVTAFHFRITGSAEYPGLLPGDSLSAGWFRGPGDSCGAAFIVGASVLYEAR